VRYEDFQSRPLELCQRLFHFLFLESDSALSGKVTNKSSPFFWKEAEVQRQCLALFPALAPTAAPAAATHRRLRSSPAPLALVAHSPSSPRRLRKFQFSRTPLINQQYHLATQLNYNPLFVNVTCDFALTQFQHAYPLFPAELREQIRGLSTKMEPYGYSLDPARLFTTETSVFEKWNLLKK
jgi:hypothetical protein